MFLVVIYSCYTHERCRFGRGCIFAHSLEELNEWEEEYSRKERDKRVKEIQDRNEILSMEMVSEILKEPAENVSVSCIIYYLDVVTQKLVVVRKFSDSYSSTSVSTAEIRRFYQSHLSIR